MGCRPGSVDVDAQDLAQQAERVLRVAGGLDVPRPLIVIISAIPHSDVQIACIPRAIAEADPPAIMVYLRLIDRRHVGCRGGIGDVGIRRHLVTRDMSDAASKCTPPGSGVIDIEFAVGGIVGVKARPNSPCSPPVAMPEKCQKRRGSIVSVARFKILMSAVPFDPCSTMNS